MTQRKKKTIEYHFVDMNDPDRYKKLKVARACDFCRRRKSKCDIGIPGSGTCSNCKKSNQICIFSPTNTTSSSIVPASSVPMIQQQQQQQEQVQDNKFMIEYQNKFPFFSMDQKAHCGYERDNSYHSTLSPTTDYSMDDHLPIYSKQFEKELFQVYFSHIHPFFPILDKYTILHSLQFDTIPTSLRLVVMAIVTSNFSHINRNDANEYYQHAINQLDHNPTLITAQTLLLLYKYQEMNTPIGISISTNTIGYLKDAQSILSQWNSDDEFVCRAKWILFIILSLSNTADKRLKTILDYYLIPSRLPALTDNEQYDDFELNTTGNLIHLCNISSIFSRTISLISESATLFSIQNNYTNDFNELSNGFKVWKSTLPAHITRYFNQDSLYSNEPTKSTFSIAYLCLIHDIIHLLISANQPAQVHDLSKLAYSICFRAHHFAMGNNCTTRLASIGGNRILSFGLTLALQTQYFCDQGSEKYVSLFSIAHQIFEQISLSPQLYMTIQAFHTQLESKKQLEQTRAYTLDNNPIHGRLDSNSSSSDSSGHSSNNNNANIDSTYYYNSNNTTPHQNNNDSNQWQHYSYNSHTNFQLYLNNSTFYPSQGDNMPTTPTFEPTELNSPDINSPYSFTTVDSYFQPQIVSYGPSVMSGPYDIIHHSIERSYSSKSCNTKPAI